MVWLLRRIRARLERSAPLSRISFPIAMTLAKKRQAPDARCSCARTQECALQMWRSATDARTDVEHARLLVREADARLMASFSALSKDARTQRELVTLVLERAAEKAAHSRAIEAISHLDAQIDRWIDTAITAMQFEDLVAQVLHRVDERLADVGARAKQFAEHRPRNTSAGACEVCSLTQRALKEDAAGPIATRSLVGGDVDLF
jgi:hypothetical protein